MIPASTVTSLPVHGQDTAASRVMSIITPSVHAMSVNEWPDPATFTRARAHDGADQLLLDCGA